MAKFSERVGANPPRALQIGSMDAGLRNALWNWVYWTLSKDTQAYGEGFYEHWNYAATGGMWDTVFGLRNHELDVYHSNALVEWVAEWCQKAEWHQVYDLIEWLLPRIENLRGNDRLPDPQKRLNYYLEREMSGYRAVNNSQVVQITSSEELAAIEDASRAKTGYEGVAEHIRTALELLGKKPEPDYRNSIKESMSAVESAAILVTGDKKSSLDKALKALERKGALHGAFKDGVSALFGWTSDGEGIRHAILNEPNVGFPEAKFMLVSCSAFANYLIDSSRIQSAS